MIDNSTKQQIKEHLINYCTAQGSDNKASKSLGISNAYVSNIRNDKWDMISEDMWRKVAKLLGVNLNEDWNHADTAPYSVVYNCLADAQLYANVYGIIAEPGTCKTHTLDQYARGSKNVFYVKCQRHTTDRWFLQELLKTMGIKSIGGSNHCLTQLREKVSRLECPLIILDEIEKVDTDVLLLFIDIYNICDGKAGIVLLGTPNLAARIQKGVLTGKVGFNEIMSRLGGRFINVPAPTKNDAIKVMQANGITEQVDVNCILNDFTDTNSFDLRRVKRLVHKIKLRLQAEAA